MIVGNESISRIPARLRWESPEESLWFPRHFPIHRKDPISHRFFTHSGVAGPLCPAREVFEKYFWESQGMIDKGAIEPASGIMRAPRGRRTP